MCKKSTPLCSIGTMLLCTLKILSSSGYNNKNLIQHLVKNGIKVAVKSLRRKNYLNIRYDPVKNLLRTKLRS